MLQNLIACLTLRFNTADADGTVVKVDFYQNFFDGYNYFGMVLIGTATSAPYGMTWNNSTVGSYQLTAVATDNAGATTTSAVLPIVVASAAPIVSITAPTAGQSFTEPSSVAVSANASSPTSTISKVEFHQSTGGLQTLIGTTTTLPYRVTWNLDTQGDAQVWAVATDAAGRQTSSAAVQISVGAALYYLYPDNLGTTRLITDSSNSIVWRNLPTTEPFGNSPVEDDPNSTGTHFIYNPRFPGQYADRESNLFYGGARYYDPSIGRFISPEPLGLAGGSWSLYPYAKSDPLRYVDPDGRSPVLWAIGIGVAAYGVYEAYGFISDLYHLTQALNQFGNDAATSTNTAVQCGSSGNGNSCGDAAAQQKNLYGPSAANAAKAGAAVCYPPK